MYKIYKAVYAANILLAIGITLTTTGDFHSAVYLAGLSIGIVASIGLFLNIRFAIKRPNWVGAAEAWQDYAICLSDEKLLETRYLSGMVLAGCEAIILALPFLGVGLVLVSGCSASYYEVASLGILITEALACFAVHWARLAWALVMFAAKERSH